MLDKDVKLLTPGPVPVPSFIKEAISRAAMPHRTAEFEEFYGALLNKLRYFFQTEAHVSIMIGSGTAGVEAAMYSLFEKGDTVIVTENGKFSERWREYGEYLGLHVIPISVAWGETITKQQVIEVLSENDNIAGCVLTHCETSTGAGLDLEEITFEIKQHSPDTLVVVDAISTVGAVPFYMDRWGIDCAVGASQKALMNPAGAACLAYSEQARSRLRQTRAGDYMNLWNYLDFADRDSYPYSPPIHLLYGIDAALDYIHSTTLPYIWNTTHQASKACKEAITALGGNIFGQTPADCMTAFSFSEYTADELRAMIESRSGYILAGGQAQLKGKILRLSHMGMARESWEGVLSCLKETAIKI